VRVVRFTIDRAEHAAPVEPTAAIADRPIRVPRGDPRVGLRPLRLAPRSGSVEPHKHLYSAAALFRETAVQGFSSPCLVMCRTPQPPRPGLQTKGGDGFSSWFS